MIIDTIDCPAMPGTKFVRFTDAGDMMRAATNLTHNKGYHDTTSSGWYGGSVDRLKECAVRGDDKYVAEAEPLIREFGNLALQDYTVEMEYNTQYGVLDYATAQAGDPMCMFGLMEEETDRAPVQVYVDTWTSCTVSSKAMRMRGVAVLAFAMALSTFRPVRVSLLTGMSHSPTKTNIIQTVDVPTAPMNISMAAWMLCDPIVFRRAMLSLPWTIAKSDAVCGIPPLSNRTFQDKHMADWMAARSGVTDCVHLGKMMGAEEWANEEFVLNWIKMQLARFMP